mgnify:CR=1 FL=1
MKHFKLLSTSLLLLALTVLLPSYSLASTTAGLTQIIEAHDSEEVICTDMNGNGMIDEDEPCSDDGLPAVDTPEG